MKKLGLLIIGGWGHGSGMLEFIARCQPSYLELIGLGMTDPGEDFSGWQKNYPFLQRVPVFSDYRQMLRECQADLAVVTTALPLIPKAVENAFQAGLSVYSEKPMAAQVDTLAKLARLARQRDLLALLTTGNYSNPALTRMRALVETGKIGEIAIANARKSYPWSEDRPSRFPINYGGTMGWVGIHALEFIALATGLEFTAVGAMESNLLSPELAECPDHVAACLELSNGGHASISLDYHRPAGSPVRGDDWIRIVGTKATAEANLSRGTFKLTDQHGESADHQLEPVEEWFSLLPLALLEGGGRRELGRQLTNLSFHLNHTAIIGQRAALEKRILPVPRQL